MSFFDMGGYAAYVWPAFSVAAAIMIALLVVSLRIMRAREVTLKRLQAARDMMRQRDTSITKPETDDDQGVSA